MSKYVIGQKLEDILEAVRIGGWYDAVPAEREPNYLDVDVANQKIKDLFADIIEAAMIDVTARNILQQKVREL